MNLVAEGIAWIFDPANYAGPQGWIVRLVEQLLYTFGATAIAAVIAVPLGYLVGHTGRGRDLAVSLSGGFRALPSLGVLILLGLGLGIGFRAPLLTFVIIAIPPILAGAYAGFESIDRKTIDAARAVGMTEWQVITQVEIPLGLPLLIGGVRSSLLQVVATATLAAYVSGGALGVFIFEAFATSNYPEALGASILVTALALALEGIFALVQKLVVPRGVVAKELKEVRPRSSRPLAVAGVPAQEGK
ncbi:ABC transporter permease [Herbiconiux daphne]|uniref:ABC transporter permease subunit n=1 Tax=Herbiconiux daphne TaxID=2970914 RepID=A0ABT2GYS1_9MICO|nr:ABC transporter permease subunit [Herbiconiux daphne]MCS5733119.1 ABC transporter permease subunit [Herbiconiux daphne]